MSALGERTLASIVLSSAALLLLSCEDSPKPASTKAPEAGPTASASAVERPPEPPTMPEVTLDTRHVQAGLDDVQLGVPSFQTALQNMVAKYPVSKPDQVVLNIARTSKLPDATNLVYVLFDAGAKAIEVRTTPRGIFPGKLLLTSDKAVSGKAPPCTYAGMVLKDLAVTYWHIRGGLGKRYSKGMAGPDLTNMHESLQKEIDTCNSTVFLFSAEDVVEWGHAFDLATSLVAHEPHYKITNYVLLREIPTAGKAVKITP